MTAAKHDQDNPVSARPTSRKLRNALLHTAFHLLYHQFAWAYDWVSRTFFRGQWRTWQRLVLPRLRNIPGCAVLEIGFGTGDLLYDMHRAGYQPVGVDLSPDMLRQAQRKALRRGSGFLLRAARACTQALPFADASFGAVVSTFPSEYIVDPATLSEIARVLRPGGRVIIVPAARLLPTDRTNRLLERFAEIVYGVRPQRTELVRQLADQQAFPGLVPRLEESGLHVIENRWQQLPTSVASVIVAMKS